jgi:hypothetical protein
MILAPLRNEATSNDHPKLSPQYFDKIEKGLNPIFFIYFSALKVGIQILNKSD